MDFATAYPLIAKAEAGLSMNPADRGNWTSGKVGVGTLKGTNYGISAASYPFEDIANMTPARAMFLTERDYWAASGCAVAPPEIRYDLFDMGFNSGQDAARRALQTGAGVAADGQIGPKTIAAIAASPLERLIERFDAARLFHVTEMSHDAWEEFGRGLVIRIATTMLANA